MTPNLGLPQIAETQAQPHVTVNEALELIDAAAPQIAVSMSRKTPPANPLDGAAYILPPGASGWGQVRPGQIAVRRADLWHAITPRPGERWFVDDMRRAYVWAGAAWRAGDVIGKTGAGLGLAVFDAVLNLTGASVRAKGLIPARAILLGVTSWTIEAVTGAASYSVGDSSSSSRFGGSLGIAKGAQNIGVIGPSATYSPGDVIVTAAGGNFTGGRVGVAVSALVPSVPL